MTGRPAAAAALALLLGGCVATQRDVLDLSDRSEELRVQVDELKATVSSMRANQADLSVQIKQLREELSAYSETVKASMGDMGKLSAKLDALAAQLSDKVSQLGTSLASAQQKTAAEQKAALETAAREGAAADLFVAAERRLQAKDYAKAAEALEAYIAGRPKPELADLAAYDLALAYHGLRQWEKAGRQFALVLDRWPKGPYAAGARLHYALCLVSLKRSPEEARAFLESVVSDFPRSPEAREAAAALKRLDAAAAPAPAPAPPAAR